MGGGSLDGVSLQYRFIFYRHPRGATSKYMRQLNKYTLTIIYTRQQALSCLLNPKGLQQTSCKNHVAFQINTNYFQVLILPDRKLFSWCHLHSQFLSGYPSTKSSTNLLFMAFWFIPQLIISAAPIYIPAVRPNPYNTPIKLIIYLRYSHKT